ncbi:MAG TPA: aldo/keto reductase [Ktedonobacteraceae bacterium]|nr:aldo/keto reductase [Ktedonobacteraceae bacterium]
MSTTLAWGIIGTGRIAHVFANGIAKSQTGTLLAVGSRTKEAADAFGETWHAARRYGSYEEVLADPDVQAVYIATPHPLHAEWAIKAAEAGKHILCEKPLALNHAEAMAVVEAAHRHDVFLMEAFMYRCHPQTQKLIELIRSGAIGQVKVIQATFSFQTGRNPESRLMNSALGGGGILDVGCYCASLARLVAGAANGKNVEEPTRVVAVGHVGETGVDEYTVASLAFPGGIVAQLFTGVQVNGENVARIFGTEGSILLPSPWTPRSGAASSIILQKNGQQETQEITVENDAELYALEADTVATHLEVRQAPQMNWEDTLGNMRTLDQWRAAIGVTYDRERPDGPEQQLTVRKRPLSVDPSSSMKYGRIDGVDKPISRLVMGVDNQVNWPHTAVMLDDFFERGGNCFDSAYIYGGGRCEKLLGQWIKNRGIREQVVILDKGAHTPHCNPESLTTQFAESLERLQVDYVDIYMMHRDNPAIPVGEFITVLNEQVNAGCMRVFGASNWSIERVSEANAWAAAHGMRGFSAMSNNFSLARMVDPVWSGCIAASDAQSRAWLTQNQVPLMPWSSQARGFFTGRAHPDDHSDEELVRCWYSEDNFRRLARVNEMAQRRGVLPINIALAYVLCQPFPTFPLIGPRQLSETRTSFPALTIELTPEELRWLNLED